MTIQEWKTWMIKRKEWKGRMPDFRDMPLPRWMTNDSR